MVTVEKEKYKKHSELSGEFKWENLVYFYVLCPSTCLLPLHQHSESSIAIPGDSLRYCEYAKYQKLFMSMVCLSQMFTRIIEANRFLKTCIQVNSIMEEKRDLIILTMHQNVDFYLFSKENTSCLFFPTTRQNYLQVSMLYYFCFSVYYQVTY